MKAAPDDLDLGLAQILPMLDEETGAEPRVLSASIADPHLLLIRDDGSIFIASIDKSNEMEEVEKPDGDISSTKWSSGCLYEDTNGLFQNTQGEEKGAVMMFLLNAAGVLHVSALPYGQVHADCLGLFIERPLAACLCCRGSLLRSPLVVLRLHSPQRNIS